VPISETTDVVILGVEGV